jgi:hypothetical protein
MLVEILAYSLLVGLLAATVAGVGFWCWRVIDTWPALRMVAARRGKSGGG